MLNKKELSYENKMLMLKSFKSANERMTQTIQENKQEVEDLIKLLEIERKEKYGIIKRECEALVHMRLSYCNLQRITAFGVWKEIIQIVFPSHREASVEVRNINPDNIALSKDTITFIQDDYRVCIDWDEVVYDDISIVSVVDVGDEGSYDVGMEVCLATLPFNIYLTLTIDEELII